MSDYLNYRRGLKTKVQQPVIDAKELDKWFGHFMAASKPVCEECGLVAKWLLKPEYEKLWKACQAHILPKKENYGFPSLATNYDNHIVLFPSWGGFLCGCHGLYDSSWYNACKMKIWSKVGRIFVSKLYPVMPDNEKKLLPEQLIKLL